ncbi:MAG: bile acid:sodium symporter [Planctomycetaceae bacterium]
MHYVQQFVERTLIFWLTLSSGFALWWGLSNPAAREYFEVCNRWTMTPPLSPPCSASASCSLATNSARSFDRANRCWGCLVQYACMPLLAFVIATLLRLEGPLFAGMVLTGAVPGAMASNVLTLAARGNVSYSISLTTVATLVSPLAVPLALFLFLGVRKGPEPSTVFVNLLQTVAVPVLAGFICKLMLRRETEFLRAAAGLIANLAILWIIAVAIGLNANRLSQVTAMMLLAMLCLNLAGYCAGWLASRIMSLDVRKVAP